MKRTYHLADLRKWHEVTADEPKPLRIAVIGDPIEHSLSPAMQNAALMQCDLPWRYARLQISPNELAETLDLLRGLEFVGFNLTAPHKTAALPLLDEIDAEARDIGAVNTVARRDGKLIGYNTDGAGFREAIRADFGCELAGLRLLLLGAGGVARAIAWECARRGVRALHLANRDLEKGKALVDEVKKSAPAPIMVTNSGQDSTILTAVLAETDLIVNATSVGLRLDDPSLVPASALAPRHLVYETIYSPAKTPLLRAAEAQGARGANGLSLLLHQGALAFGIWFEQAAPLDAMREVLLV